MSTTYDDPNREAVGLPPIWTGADAVPEPKSDSFDPGEHTVAEVEDYLAANPDEHAKVLAAEAKGKNRTSLVGSHDE
jgi:hypothetical protein